MKILKEAIDINNPQACKQVCDLIAGKSAQNLVDLLTGKASKSQDFIDALTEIAKAIISKDQRFPTKRLDFFTRNMPKFNNRNSTEYIDFAALVKDKGVNPLNILGLLSIPLYHKVLTINAGQIPTPYEKFISMFSEDGNFDNLSYILLGEFTEAFNVDNIDTENEFIKNYLNTTLFTKSTRTRKSFERVYNSYVNDNRFDDYSIKQILKKTN